MHSLYLLAFLVASGSTVAQQGTAVAAEAKLSSLEGALTTSLPPHANLGLSTVVLGDLDGDGMREIAAGAFLTNPATTGSFLVMFLNPDLTVRHEQVVNESEGGFTGQLPSISALGYAMASLGDLDGDGTEELAVGTPFSQGVVFLLDMNADGTVRSHVEIGAGKGGFGGTLGNDDFFGASLASLPDLDGDGVGELAVGAPETLEVFLPEGAVWILLLNPDGTVKAQQKLSTLQGGLSNLPSAKDAFGCAVVSLGDIDGDGSPELAIGAPEDDAVSLNEGSVWIVSLNPDGTAKRDSKISTLQGGLSGPIDSRDRFGASLAFLGDIDADGFPDLAVGAPGDDDGGTDIGAVYLLGLRPDGSVAVESKISAQMGSFEGPLNGSDALAESVASAGDLNGDGIPELLVGAPGDDDGPDAFINRGALWILSLASRGSVSLENGTGLNPPCFSTAGAPELGATWTGDIDASAHPTPQVTIVAARDSALPQGIVIPAGELLVDLFTGGFQLDVFLTSGGGIDMASIFVPSDLTLLGFELHAQAALLGGGSATLCNALTLIVGA